MRIFRISQKAILCLLVLMCFFVPRLLQAESTPGDTLMMIMGKVRETGSNLPVLDYVHWPTAYSRLTPDKKKRFKVSSPDELQDRYREMMVDPVGFTKKQMEARLNEMPPQQQGMMRQIMMSMEDKSSELLKKVGPRLRGTIYEVVDTELKDDTAFVSLVSSFEGQKQERRVELVKRDGSWMLPSVEDATGQKPAKRNQANIDEPKK